MKVVTLDKIKWDGDTTFFTPAETRGYYGVSRQVKAIVIHWWNAPEVAGTLSETVSYLKRVEESIHFVVSGDSVIQMVNMANTAFHCGRGNPTTVGIEVDPRTPGNTYETVGALVKFIRGYYGNIPLQKHSQYVSTACPGTVDLRKIDDYAYGRIATKPAPVTLASKQTFSPAKHYRVTADTTLVNIPAGTKYGVTVFKKGHDVGDVVEKLRYSNGKEFYRTKYARDTAKKMYGFPATKLTEVVTPVVEPKPVPPKPTEQEQKLDDLTNRVTAVEKLLATLVDFVASIFKGFTK